MISSKGACAAILLALAAWPAELRADWLKTEGGCLVHMDRLPEKATATWSGGCTGGKASGEGTFAMTTEREGAPYISRIIGRMEEGRPVGVVTLEPGTGDRYRGELVEGLLVGGEIAFADGRRYKGGIANGVPQGEGTMIYGNGAVHSGVWHEGKRHGPGVFRSAEGYVAVGTFRKGRLTGRARFTLPGGSWYEGPTKDGRPHGKGRCAASPDAEPQACRFRAGRPVE